MMGCEFLFLRLNERILRWIRDRAVAQGSGVFRSYPVLSDTHEGHHCQEGVRTWPGGYVLPSGLG